MRIKSPTSFLFVLVITISVCRLNAQTSWCRPGAVWTYNIGMGMGSGVATMQYVGDTLINGITCNKLLTTTTMASYPDLGLFFVYQDSNKVYVMRNSPMTYPAPDTSFHVLYDFNLVTGDSFTVVPFPGTSSIIYGGIPLKFQVSGTDTDTINGEILKAYYVQYTANVSNWFGAIYDRIGSTASFLPQFIIADLSYIYQLACYTDNSGWYYPSGSGACGVSGIEESKDDLGVFPNPASEIVTLDLKKFTGKKEIMISGMDRVLSYTSDTNETQIQIDCKEWNSGLYIIKVFNAHQSAISRFIVAH